jgi:broad specificity phosphatase PhoE
MSWWNETILPLAKEPGDRTVLVTSHGAYILVRHAPSPRESQSLRLPICYCTLQTLFRQLMTDTAHGGLGYPLTGQALQEHPFRHCANTSISMVRVDKHGNGVVERFNDHAHLGGDMGLVVSKDVAA